MSSQRSLGKMGIKFFLRISQFTSKQEEEEENIRICIKRANLRGGGGEGGGGEEGGGKHQDLHQGSKSEWTKVKKD